MSGGGMRDLSSLSDERVKAAAKALRDAGYIIAALPMAEVMVDALVERGDLPARREREEVRPEAARRKCGALGPERGDKPGRWRCSLPPGHEGDHRAVTSGRRWPA